MKKVFIEISQNSQENTCARFSFFNKIDLTLCKKDSDTGVSCEFYEISKNTFSYRIPLMGASEKEMICEILIFKYQFFGCRSIWQCF